MLQMNRLAVGINTRVFKLLEIWKIFKFQKSTKLMKFEEYVFTEFIFKYCLIIFNKLYVHLLSVFIYTLYTIKLEFLASFHLSTIEFLQCKYLLIAEHNLKWDNFRVAGQFIKS